MKKPSYKIEKREIAEGSTYVIGCDEVGRGCLAGPVVAAAVVLSPERLTNKRYKDICDSKMLVPEKRFMLAKMIQAEAIGWGIGVVPAELIDAFNIHHASLLAMHYAVRELEQSVTVNDSYGTNEHKVTLLLDGKFVLPHSDYKQQAIVNGDATVISISAASIIAKVYRDELMAKLHTKFPAYRFDQHKGYATSIHRTAIEKYGLSAVHRLSFCGNIL